MRFAVIGNPIAHSLSPAMHRAAYAALGLEHSYDPMLVTDIGAQINELKTLDGINITVPHKEAMLAYCEADEFARRAGAVNTIDWKSNRGINTDGAGFSDVLARETPGAQSILILGAGGTTRSLALALTQAAYQVTIWNRTESRAHELVTDLEIPARVSSTPQLPGQDVIVNATSAGLTDETLPLDWGEAEPSAVFFDLYYGTEPTQISKTAAEAGLRTIDGRELLIAQGARSFSWWLQREAPVEAMRAAVYG